MDLDSPERDPPILWICHKTEVALQISMKRRDYAVSVCVWWRGGGTCADRTDIESLPYTTHRGDNC